MNKKLLHGYIPQVLLVQGNGYYCFSNKKYINENKFLREECAH